MNYIEAPNNIIKNSIFLAGGITNCPDWQKEVVKALDGKNITVFNPRRENFPIGIKGEAVKQIEWEHKFLRLAERISLWFPKETLCPIVLYELGTWSMTKKLIFIGMDPDYERRVDVEIQTRLVRPDVKIVYDLKHLICQILAS